MLWRKSAAAWEQNFDLGEDAFLRQDNDPKHWISFSELTLKSTMLMAEAAESDLRGRTCSAKKTE